MLDKDVSLHGRPIDGTPFEAFYHGAWHGIDNVVVKDARLFIQVNHQGSLTEDNIHGDKLRLRSRKANASDCVHFLKPGIDVCVLSANPVLASPDQEPQPLCSWHDAKIISIKRSPHKTRCSCLFSVIFTRHACYTLGRVAEVVSVENIAILQKLNCAPSDEGVYEWKLSEDCSSLSKSRLLSEEFSSEVSWLIVLSYLRKMEFEIKVLNSRIVYRIVNSHHQLRDKETAILRFQKCSGTLRPKIETLVLSMDTEGTTPERTIEVEPISYTLVSDSDVEILYDCTNLRHSKRRKMVPDRFVPLFKRGRYDESNINEHPSLHGDSSSSKVRLFSSHSDHRRKNLLGRSKCKQMIKNAMENIHSELEKQFQPTTQWSRNLSTNFVEEIQDFKWSSDSDSDTAKDEHEDLWKEMEYSLTTLSLFNETKDLGSEFVIETRDLSDKHEEEACKHDYELNEEVGIICRLCKFVCTEIRYVLPPFVDGLISLKEKRGHNEFNCNWPYHLGLDPLSNSPTFRDMTLSEGYENAWSLIPEYKVKLHPHQKKAFEFIWTNIAGSLKPEEMDHFPDKTGGCVISHAPGSGKTLLVLSFLVSYLRLYPRSRPLILAPKSAIYTWLKEFEKWGVLIPVYQIHAVESFKMGMADCEMESFSTKIRRPSKKLMHVMDSLAKLRQWHENPSILLMSYSSFFSMSQEDSKLEYRRFMADVLHKSPGILILDEGHNPRSSTSKLRKLLMKVKTEFRILLSGTLFQNNFQEYFNTLCLARPRFSRDVTRKLDPHMINVLKGRGKKRPKLSQSEKFARKLFMEKVGQQIESARESDRKKGFELLSSLTTMFIDTYEGGISGELPGLQIYTLLLTSTTFQQEILMKLAEFHRSIRHKRCPLEVELLITVGSIHPSLIKTISCSRNFFDAGELEKIDQCRGNFKSGSKAKFIVDLVHKCSIRDEKVLVFCHNIPPIHFFVDLLEAVFGWHRNEEILVLQGDQELSVRAKIMDKFNAVPSGKCRVLLASTTACAEGISLTAASRVVLVDSEWNHSKTRQAIARAFRPGQQKMVYVYRLLASGTWEEDKYDSSAWKAWLSKMIFMGQYINYPSSREVEDVDDEVLREMVDENQKKIFQMIMKHEWSSD